MWLACFKASVLKKVSEIKLSLMLLSRIESVRYQEQHTAEDEDLLCPFTCFW